MSAPVGVRLSATRTRTTNDHGQPLGRPVEWSGATPPAEDRVLEGRGVRLEPVGRQHVDELVAALCRADDDPIWTYLSWERPRSRDEMASPRPVPSWRRVDEPSTWLNFSNTSCSLSAGMPMPVSVTAILSLVRSPLFLPVTSIRT